MSRRFPILALLAAAAWGVDSYAQQSTTRPAPTSVASARAPEYAGTARVSSRLLDEQGGQVVVLPSEPGEAGEQPSKLSGGALAKLPSEVRPLPEGYMLVQRPGKIVPAGSGYVFEMEHVRGLPDAPPMRVLPNTRLGVLESIFSEGSKLKRVELSARTTELEGALKSSFEEGSRQNRFAVTGRVTEFQGANYLLLENVTEQVEQLEPAKTTPEVAVTPSDDISADHASTQPVTGREPTAEEIMRQLMQDRPMRAVAPPEESRQPQTAPATPEPDAPLPGAKGNDSVRWPDGAMLSDRMVRLMPSENSWMVAFEDPGRNPRDTPIRVLPSRLLENAISLTAGGTRGVVLVVSGEITAYKNSNYLLIRKVLVRRDNGNLR